MSGNSAGVRLQNNLHTETLILSGKTLVNCKSDNNFNDSEVCTPIQSQYHTHTHVTEYTVLYSAVL